MNQRINTKTLLIFCAANVYLARISAKVAGDNNICDSEVAIKYSIAKCSTILTSLKLSNLLFNKASSHLISSKNIRIVAGGAFIVSVIPFSLFFSTIVSKKLLEQTHKPLSWWQVIRLELNFLRETFFKS